MIYHITSTSHRSYSNSLDPLSEVFQTFDPRTAHAPASIGAFVVELVVLFSALDDDSFLVVVALLAKDGHTVAGGVLDGGFVDC